jgi:hypothetical protein
MAARYTSRGTAVRRIKRQQSLAIKEAAERGWTVERIAEHACVTEQSVVDLLRYHKLPIKRRPTASKGGAIQPYMPSPEEIARKAAEIKARNLDAMRCEAQSDECL